VKDEAQITQDMWLRYQYLRDSGHTDFVQKALKCDEFFCGLQWSADDLVRLRNQRRPALTINKIISTISNILGEQIYNRTEIAYRARAAGATDDVADALTKVMMQVSDNNMLNYTRSDVFADGIITGRGYYDIRLDFTDNLMGEVRISRINPKSVLLDVDAETYDVKGWGDVMISRWMSADEIAVLYSKEKAEELAGRVTGAYPFSYDILDWQRDRFGTPPANTFWMGAESMRRMARMIRVVERQWRKLDRVEHFVNLQTGDSRVVPTDWERNKISAYLSQNQNIGVMKKLIQRVRWTVVADNQVLHDDWSEYDDLSIVPFFPHFRSGRTVGLVENLLGPQEYLNKIRSQELHVVNTTANSGWIVPDGALSGSMTMEELEERGAETGLVIPTSGKDSGLEKITPNQVPTGLDRLSHKADGDFQSISGVSDSMMGMAREDVSGKAIKQNKAFGSANLAKVMDNLMRTDRMVASRVLNLVQEFYTEERLVQVTKGPFGGTEQVTVNQITPEGKILNDLTLGEYDVIVTSQPERDTYEDSQYDQLVMMQKELGIRVPKEFLVLNSQVREKTKLIQALDAQENSPEAKQMAELQMRTRVAEVDKLEGEAQSKKADAKLRLARAHKEINEQLQPAEDPKLAAQIELQKTEMEGNIELQKMERKFALERDQLKQKQQLELEKHQQEMQMQREKHEQEKSIREDDALARQAQMLSQPGAENADSQRGAPAGSGG
jgi:hypothetical protein